MRIKLEQESQHTQAHGNISSVGEGAADAEQTVNTAGVTGPASCSSGDGQTSPVG